MLVPSKFASRRPRKGSALSQGGYLYTCRETAAYDVNSLILDNGTVKFIFERDKATGVRLKSFKHKDGQVQTNYTSSLWSVGINTSEIAGDSYGIYPNDSNFDASSFTKKIRATHEEATFIWRNVALEQEARIYFDIHYKVRLNTNEDFLQCSIELRDASNPGQQAIKLQSVALAAVCLLNLALLTEDDNTDDWIFTTPLGQGDSIMNPIRNLRSTTPVVSTWLDNPHVLSLETVEAHYEVAALDDSTILKANRILVPTSYSGEILNSDSYPEMFFKYPVVNPIQGGSRMSVAHPGRMFLPAVSLGNSSTKDGSLFFAKDPDGLSAKNFQWWSDGRKLRLQIWDYTDYEVDPYSLSKNQGGAPYIPLWSACIRPFKSPTRHVDFYSMELYRDEVVPLQEYIPAPLWKRAISGEVDQRVAHQSILVINAGITSGSGNSSVDTVSTYNQIIKQQYGIAYDPIIANHFIPRDLVGTTGQMYNWLPWATGATGDNNFRLPDNTGTVVNAKWGNLWRRLLQTGAISSSYIVNYFAEHNSDYLSGISGYDLTRRTLPYVNYYGTRAAMKSGVLDDLLCYAATFAKERYQDIARNIGASGSLTYVDVCGQFSNGCYAKKHTYYTGSTAVTITHPRAGFSRFFNKLEYENFVEFFKAGSSGFSGLGYYNKDVGMLSSAEYLPDVYIAHKTYTSAIRVGENMHKGHYTLNPFSVNGLTLIYNQTKHWHVLTPSMYIALGDRMYNGGYFPHVGNPIDSARLYYYYSGLSGFDYTGGYLNEVYNVETGVAWRSLAAKLAITKEALYGGRAIVQHYNEDAFNYAPGVTAGMLSNETGWLSGAVWTGVKEYLYNWVRYVGVCKDYIPQGVIRAPLDEWRVNATGSIYNYEINSTRFSRHTGDIGEEAILHTVRKHRVTNKHLISMFNWTNTNVTYSGKFSPLCYNLNSSYDVYAIDAINTTGVRTYITHKHSHEDYSFSGTISGGSNYLLEIVPAKLFGTKAIDQGSYSDFSSNRLPVRYSYSATFLSVYTLSIAYSYGSQLIRTIAPVYAGFKSATAQAILNNVPQWMTMRQKTDSNGWQLVNSWGMALDKVNDLASDKLKNLFCYTADRTSKFKLFKGTVKVNEPFEYKDSRNLLFNSGFTIKDAARTRLPMGWADYSPTNSSSGIYDDDSIIGSKSLKISQPSFKVGQLRVINKKLTNVCGSLYIKSSDRVVLKLLISCETINGIITNYEKLIDGTFSKWTRFYASGMLNSEVYRYSFVFVVISGEANISCLQLEDSVEPTPWQPGFNDIPYFLDNGLPYKMVQVLSDHRKLVLYPVTTAEDFSIIDIPTRAEQVLPPNDKLEESVTSVFGRVVDFYKSSIPLKWTVQNNKISVADANNDNEVYSKYSIREVRWFDDSGYGTADVDSANIEPKALTINGNYLYVISKDRYRDSSCLALKIVKAKIPPTNTDYLESVNDIYLDTDITWGSGEEITNVAISEMYSNILILSTNFNRKLYIKLYFDYYYINASNRNIYTLEDYENSVIQVI